jgi:hypothetical protein
MEKEKVSRTSLKRHGEYCGFYFFIKAIELDVFSIQFSPKVENHWK